MAITFKTPAMSFVTFTGETPAGAGCLDEPVLCLPFHKLSELMFQVIVAPTADVPTKPLGTDFKLSLCTDCGETIIHDIGYLNWQTDINGTSFLGTPVWTDENLDVSQHLDEGDCFQICISRRSQSTVINGYRWDVVGSEVPFPLMNVHVQFAGNSDYEVYGSFADVQDLLPALNAILSDYGQTQLSFSEDTGYITGSASQNYGSLVITFADSTQHTVPMGTSFGSGSTYAPVGCSSCFIYTPSPCFSTAVKYRCRDNAFGFRYYNDVYDDGTNALADHYTAVRLPFFLRNAEPKFASGEYRRSDGEYVKRFASGELEQDAEVDGITATWHRKLSVMTQHDTVLFYDERSAAWVAVSCEGTSYKVNWIKTRGILHPLATADFVVKYPFAQFNSNCR